jgi:Putative DNA-binding domain
MQAVEPGSAGYRLQDWQSTLQDCVVDPQLDRARLRAWLCAGPAGTDVQLDIYSNAYVMRLVEALRCNYPALVHALGDEDFAVMAGPYLEQHPSVHASIRWFGAALAGFLQEREPYCQVPVLSELAAFEWAIRHTIDAADAERLTVDTLLSVPADGWSDLRFDLHPSVTLLFLQWNVPQLWHTLSDEGNAPPAEPAAPARQPAHWLVYRKPDLASGWRSLSAMERAALERVQQGADFGEICECVALQDNCDSALQAAGFLRTWVEQGILVLR